MCRQLLEGSNKQYAIYDNSGRMPTWGGGHDLGIYSPCNISNDSYAKPYYTYEAPKEAGVDDKNFLAGAYNFKLEEMEIYQVVSKGKKK